MGANSEPCLPAGRPDMRGRCGQCMAIPIGLSFMRGFFVYMIYDSIFTSESVCAGHPDKICDQISDAIVDAVLTNDPKGRVAVETLATYNRVVLAGEVTAAHAVDYDSIAREEIRRLGYTADSFNFSHTSPISVYVHTQSLEIATGVDKKGAGDQGMMFGFACEDTDSFMPMPITIAHGLAKRIDEVREKKIIPFLYPDGKTQVSVAYKNGKPVAITNVVLAVPHKKSVSLRQVKSALLRHVVNDVLQTFDMRIKANDVIVNGTGVWHRGGPASDTGLTGRKIVVDTYGGFARVGGGCFSGKDPTKVDRSGAYAARFLAKNIVAQKLAKKAEVRLAYFIGATKPVMQDVETFGTEKKSKKAIRSFMDKLLDTSVSGIIKQFDLLRPIYKQTAVYGHFGRNEFPWEKIKDV